MWQVLGPGPNARHGWSYFEPEGQWQVARGREIYRASGRTIAYLGDWHTHPHGSAVPSARDRQTALDIATDTVFRAPEPLYGIVARSLRHFMRKRFWELAMYMFVDGELKGMAVELFDA